MLQTSTRKDPENVTEHVVDGTNATVRSSKMGLEVSSKADHFVRVYEEVLVSRRSRIHPLEIKCVYKVADYIRELPFAWSVGTCRFLGSKRKCA